MKMEGHFVKLLGLTGKSLMPIDDVGSQYFLYYFSRNLSIPSGIDD